MSTAVVRAESSPERERLADMQRSFDQSFARALVGEGESLERMIMIRLAGEPFAIRASQITGLVKAKRIVPLPSRIPELLGLAGIRGTLLAVFDLTAVLELQSRGSTPAWLALAGRDLPIALAFDEFEGQLELAQASLYAEEGGIPRRHGQLLARIGSSVHPVIDIPSILELMRKRTDLIGPGKE